MIENNFFFNFNFFNFMIGWIIYFNSLNGRKGSKTL